MSGLLYRSHRPQVFADVIGQSHVVKTVQEALRQDNVAHAYLFCGPRGVGKTTIARLIAKGVNCDKKKDGDVCDSCDSCVSVREGRAIDVMEVDAASNRGIDEIRELREKVRVAPTLLQRRVVIIDEAHMLTKEAFNALLKTLEEPPEHTMFILATTQPQKIHTTIISRCQRFDYRRISISDLKEHLGKITKEEKKQIDDEALELVARSAGGSSRDSLSLLSQVFLLGDKVTEEDVRGLLGITQEEAVRGILSAIISGETNEGLTHLHKARDEGMDLETLSALLLEKAREWLLASAQVEGYEDAGMPEKVSIGGLQKVIAGLLEARKLMNTAPVPELPLETAIIELAGAQESVSAHITADPPPERSSSDSSTNSSSGTTSSDSSDRTRLSLGVSADASRRAKPETPPRRPSKEIVKESTQHAVQKKPTETPIQRATSGNEINTSLDDIQEKWSQIQRAVQKERSTFGMSFQTLVPLEIDKNIVVLACSFDLHCKRWKEAEAKEAFGRAFKNVFGEEAGIRVLHDSDLTDEQQGVVDVWKEQKQEREQRAAERSPNDKKAIFGDKVGSMVPKPADTLLEA